MSRNDKEPVEPIAEMGEDVLDACIFVESSV